MLISLGILDQHRLTHALIALIIVLILDFLFRDKKIIQNLSNIDCNLQDLNTQLSELCGLPFKGIAPTKLIRDTEELKVWTRFENSLDAFNAPWMLAVSDLYPAFLDLVQKPHFKIRILVFKGESSSEKKEYEIRIKRLSKLHELYEKDGIKNITQKIIVKSFSIDSVPTTTFFLSRYLQKPIGLLYIYPLLQGDRPIVSFEVSDSAVVKSLRNQFEKYWEQGEPIDLST